MGPVACLLWVARCRSRWDHRPPLSSEGRASDAIGTKTQLQDFVRKSPDPRSDWIFSRFTRPFSCNPYKKKSGVGGWAGSLFWVTVMDTCPYWQLTEPLARLIKAWRIACSPPACVSYLHQVNVTLRCALPEPLTQEWRVLGCFRSLDVGKSEP